MLLGEAKRTLTPRKEEAKLLLGGVIKSHDHLKKEGKCRLHRVKPGFKEQIGHLG